VHASAVLEGLRAFSDDALVFCCDGWADRKRDVAKVMPHVHESPYDAVDDVDLDRMACVFVLSTGLAHEARTTVGQCAAIAGFPPPLVVLVTDPAQQTYDVMMMLTSAGARHVFVCQEEETIPPCVLHYTLSILSKHRKELARSQQAAQTATAAAQTYRKAVCDIPAFAFAAIPRACTTVKEHGSEGFGEYQFKQRLGQGQYGLAMLAVSQAGDVYAVKVLIKAKVTSPSSLLRFDNEIFILQRLQHKNIVRAHKVVHARFAYYLVMDYAGNNLFRLLRGGPFSVPDALPLFRQLVDAIFYCHQRGVAHCDLKPENVGYHEQQLRVLDFGFAHISGMPVTTMGGTVPFTPPEMARATEAVPCNGFLADVWSLGVIFLEMINDVYCLENLLDLQHVKGPDRTYQALARFCEERLWVPLVNKPCAREPELGKQIEAMLSRVLVLEEERGQLA